MINEINSIEIQGGYFSSAANFKLFDNDVRMSIIYGKNGSGKSSISKAISSTGGEYVCRFYDANHSLLTIPSDSIFVFNEDFINKQVQIKEEGLDAIVLLGDKVDIAKQIDEKKSEYEKVEKDKNTTKEVFDSTYNSPRNALSPTAIMSKIKEKLKENGNWVSRKEALTNGRTNVTDTIIKTIFEGHTLISSNLQDAIEQYESICRIIGNSQQGTLVEKIETISVSEDFWNQIDGALKKKIERPNITERDKLIVSIYDKRGKSFFDEIKNTFTTDKESVCPFCFRSVSTDEKSRILDDIKAALSEIANEHMTELAEKKRVIDALVLRLSVIQSTAVKLKDLFPNDFITFDAYSHIVDQILSDYSQQLDNKMNSIYTPIVINNNDMIQHLQNLNASITALEEDRVKFNEQTAKVKQNRKKAIILNDDIAYWELNDRYNEYKQAQKTYDELFDKIKAYDLKLDSLQKKIESLNAQNHQIDIAAGKINKNLEYVFMCQNRLELEIENDTYYLKSKGKRVKPNEVSTGERNIIALCYFFSKILENHHSSDNYSSECLLVIDDPISSFDMENKVGILSYLNLKMSEIYKGSDKSKAVILSHDYQTIFDLGKIASEVKAKYNISTRTFELKNKQISIIGDKAEKNQYSLLMKEIYKYANGKADMLSDFTVGNSMCKLLEAYSTFVYKKGINDLASDDMIMNCCGDYKDFFQNFMFRLILNGESHYEEKVDSQDDVSFYNTFSPDQLKDTAKKIICFLHIINPDHVSRHLSDKGNSLGDFKSQIEKWKEKIPKDI